MSTPQRVMTMDGPRVEAHYACLGCGTEWRALSGPQDDCPLCRSRYCKWLDFPEGFWK